MKNLILISIVALLFVSCSCSPKEEAPFATAEITSEKIDEYNYTFTAITTGEFALLEWVMPSGETISHSTTISHYFPAKGEYTVKLKLWKEGKSVEASCTVQIANDDPTNDYELVWSDEFSGNAVNTNDWTFEEGYIANDELQDYKKEGNTIVSDGTLKIIAKKVNDNKQFGSYTSARIITAGKREFQYGRIEAKLKMPLGTGTWPAFWLLGSNIYTVPWPRCGEIDIMEYVGYDPHKIHGSLHAQDYNGGNSRTGTTTVANEGEWNIYGVTWSEQRIEFYVGEPTNVYASFEPTGSKNEANWPYDQKFFVILNLAIGGQWGGQKGVDNSIFPVTYEIDYVRVYQKK